MSDLSAEQTEAFHRDGAVLLGGLFADWTDTIAAGIERNLREPSAGASNPLGDHDTGRFFDDYCNWERIAEFAHVVRDSPAARVAAALMGSATAQFFHDHVLVKEPGTSKPTPWHQDAPYYFVDGTQTVSMWIPVDPVGDTTLRFVAGSHLWPKYVLPVRWLNDARFYPDDDDFVPVPNPDADATLKVLEWPMEPGDAVAFSFRTVHGARSNPGTTRRRALSLRFVGDDARFVERPGPTSPPYPGHSMKQGDRLRADWFPIVHPTETDIKR